jgi:hypothetical protein
MLTGLHTCGLLGTSLQHLFIKSDQTKVLCYVSCCYHLMNEEFVLTPFTDGLLYLLNLKGNNVIWYLATHLCIIANKNYQPFLKIRNLNVIINC